MPWTAPRTWVALEKVTAAQLNTHLRDNLLAAFPNGTVWDVWSPSYTNITVGNGTVVARFRQFGEEVACRWSLTLGSTSAIGSGPKVTLPVTAASDYVDFYNLGQTYMRDNPGSITVGHVRFNSTARNEVELRTLTGDNVSSGITSSVPHTWATGDEIGFDATYEAA